MNPKILYCGDSKIGGPANYLLAILTRMNQSFQHIAPDEKLGPMPLHENLGLIVLSDYPAEKISKQAGKRIEELVKAGAGFLMIGGWGSFGGCLGRYDRSPIAKLLPVHLKRNDQVNWAGGLAIKKHMNHPVVKNLSFDKPPVICGYNAVRPRGKSQVLLEAYPKSAGNCHSEAAEGGRRIYKPIDPSGLLCSHLRMTA